jgi:PAS domain S-box-containing protein
LKQVLAGEYSRAMLPKPLRILKPWLITATIVLATGTFKLAVNRYFSIDSPILLFFTAITLSSWLGGLRQGVAATAFSAFFVWWNFIDSPTNATAPHVWITRMSFFAVEGFAISLICSALRNSRDELRLSETRLRRMFETNMIGLCISDHEGNIHEANDYYLKLLGADPKLLAEGRLNWRDFTDPDSRDRSAAAARELREAGYTRPFEKEYIRPDGTRVAALVAATQVDAQSNIAFILDMSQSRMAERLSQSEKFLESVIEFIPNMIFVKDAKDLRFVRFNRAGEELLGHPRSALIGKSDYDFFPKEQADFFVNKDRAVLKNRQVVDISEEPIATSHGTRYLHTKKIPLLGPDGEPEYLIGISEDITEKKSAERQKIALLQAQVAREEAEKTADRMATLTEQANEANRAKSAFLANISHELRTPLGAMLGFAELALDELNPERTAEYVRTVLRNGRELMRIVDEVLDLSKAESNSMRIENVAFSPPELLEDIRQLMEVRANQKGLDLIFKTQGPLPKVAVADPFRLRQILLNVIGNAIKFTEQGIVSVTASAEDHRLRFIVTDSGIGIPQEQSDRLFRPFTQADDSTTRKFGGTGLGLFLSRNLAHRMGGDVRLLESKPARVAVSKLP